MTNATTAVSQRSEVVVVTEHCPDRPYLELRVPGDLEQARSVKFTVASRDQGWTSEQNDFASWTWFQANVYRPYGRNNLAPRHLYQNRKANPEFFEHVRELNGDWVEALRPGDIIELVPRAMYACWLNIIQYAKVELQYQTKNTEIFPSLITTGINRGLYTRQLIGEELRVLILLPGSMDSPIKCELNYIDLKSMSSYDALSYCWGNDRATTEIEVVCGSDRQNVNIACSVHDALKSLRGSKPLILWIDAICVNQSDEVEKVHQVSMMASIFAKAQTVHVWLGIDEATDYALRIVRDIYNVVREDCAGGEVCTCRGTSHTRTREIMLAEDLPDEAARRNTAVMTVYDFHCKKNSGKIEAMAGGYSHHVSILMSHLFENPWFRRVWVLQEVKRAKSVLVHCRATTISWEDLDCVSKWMDADTFTRLLPNVHVGITAMPEVWGTIAAENSNDMLQVVLASLDLKATDGRDKLFAVLSFGLKNPMNLHPLIAPNYRKVVGHVFADFTRWWIIENQSLAILSYIHGHRDRTWVRVAYDRNNPVLRPAWSFPQDGRLSWGKATLEDQCKYRASGKTTVNLTYLRDQGPGSARTLKLLGYKVASIERIAGWGYQGNPDHENYSELFEAMHSVIDPANIHEHWKTRKVAGDEERNNFGGRWGLHLQGHNEFERSRSYVDLPGMTAGPQRPLTGDCADAFCFETDNDMYGLCPWRAQRGDLIVILLGGNVPFILRAFGENFELVGECFVMGIMGGTFTEAMQNKGRKAEMFSLI